MKKYKLIEHTDSRGTLIPMDFDDYPKRCFFIKGAPIGTIRGGHAHSKETQILLCISGEIVIRFEYKLLTSISGGQRVGKHNLLPGEYVILRPQTWCTQKYLDKDSILISFCSEDFDENDYIRNYKDFIKG